MRHDLDRTLPWLRQGESFLRATVDRLADGDFAAPSALPEWSRAHVVGHVARNAEALTRLATWARTGVESPMYGSPEERTEEIEASAKRPPDTLRQELSTTSTELDGALAALDDDAWQARVRSALGRDIPAVEIPWMRVREVWLHAVDLGAGVTVADLPAGVVDTLLDDATGVLSGKDGCPAARLEPTDRDRGWQLGPDGDDDADAAVTVAGPAADVLAWLIGRADGSSLQARDGELPTPPRWL